MEIDKTNDTDVVPMPLKDKVDQPVPKFSLTDLEHKIGRCYDLVLNFTKKLPVQNDNLKEANGTLQELLVIISKLRADCDSIDDRVVNLEVQDYIKTEKPEFYVCGVQLWENGKLSGTSCYTNVVKARQIRDAANKEFARLRVNHECKIVQYPVF